MIKKNLIMIKFLIFFSILCTSVQSLDSSIAVKVNNEIITTFDIQQEANYLGALNNDLDKLDELTKLKIAKNSLVRETIKKNEIIKYFKLNNNKTLVNDFLLKFYTKLNHSSEKEFENYLITFDVKLEDVKKKFEIEMLWNELIKQKFSNQININKEFLKKKINDEKLSEKSLVQYELSEILFKTNQTKNLINQNNIIKDYINTNGFKNAANIYSISDTSKIGGKIGWVNESQLSKNINRIIGILNIGEISEPIETGDGYLILKIDNKKEKNIQIDEEEILKNLINYELQRQYNQFSRIYYSKIKLNSQISE